MEEAKHFFKIKSLFLYGLVQKILYWIYLPCEYFWSY